MTESVAFEHKWIPGPSRYNVSTRLTKPKTQFFSNFGKSTGREKEVQGKNQIQGKKPSSVGPATYKIEVAMDKISRMGRAPSATFSGVKSG